MTDVVSGSGKKDLLLEEFLRYLANERNASSRTLKAYRHALTAFRAENHTPWKKCKVDDFRDYLFELMKNGQARSYIRLQFSAFRTFYRFLVERKKLALDPVRQAVALFRHEGGAQPPNSLIADKSARHTVVRGALPLRAGCFLAAEQRGRRDRAAAG